MKKYEIIRQLFDIIMRVGYDDNKQDAISCYTRDKLENTVYVKKVDLHDKNKYGIDSIAVTSLSKDFKDSCDSDVRVKYKSVYNPNYMVVYANELSEEWLMSILNDLTDDYGKNSDEYNYKILLNTINHPRSEDPNFCNVVPKNALLSVLNKFKKIVIDN